MAGQSTPPFSPLPLPSGISESYVPTDDLTYHILEAGYSENPKKPLILLLHGFPEIAYSWRKVMPLLAAAGYYVVAYDQRGYGRTTGWDTRSFSEVDLSTFRNTTLVIDAMRLVSALGYDKVTCVAGHDFGAVGAHMCAYMRPDIFKSVVTMSHPIKAVKTFAFDTFRHPPKPSHKNNDDDDNDIHQNLAALPTPRKHYKEYYSTPPANQEMTEPKSSLHTFLRGYFHLKSADWPGNTPHPLTSWSASELAKMPHYYIMPLHLTMREAVAQDMASENPAVVQQKSSRWLPDHELAVYAEEWARTGFQGGLNWYRMAFEPSIVVDEQLFAGRRTEVPALFIAGRQDWGTYQVPGVVEGLGDVYAEFRGVRIVDGAGHWVQQEQPERVVAVMLEFLRGL